MFRNNVFTPWRFSLKLTDFAAAAAVVTHFVRVSESFVTALEIDFDIENFFRILYFVALACFFAHVCTLRCSTRRLVGRHVFSMVHTKNDRLKLKFDYFSSII